ncbi:MAG: class I SAM-dependent methyltransferase [Brevefilum sp.]|nr:class I SAM-dependent methyltransferase [Brevefilum sp.]
MTDDISDIAAYYNRNPASEHRRLEENQLEFELTWRFFDAYLPPSGEILEIGAGTGRYTLGLVQRGYTVTVVEISRVNLDACREYLAEAGLQDRAKYILGDARDLSDVSEKEYDAVLLMGPLYHLVLESDRRMAVREACAHLRPHGVIFSALISRYGIWADQLKNFPEVIEFKDEIRSVLDNGKDHEKWPKGGFRAYGSTVDEIAPLHEDLGFETIKLVGVEPAISASDDDERYNKLEGERRQLWLDLFYEISSEPSILGASRHLLYIGRKKG